MLCCVLVLLRQGWKPEGPRQLVGLVHDSPFDCVSNQDAQLILMRQVRAMSPLYAMRRESDVAPMTCEVHRSGPTQGGRVAYVIHTKGASRYVKRNHAVIVVDTSD